MKNEMRNEITFFFFWLSYVVFLASAWKNVGMTLVSGLCVCCKLVCAFLQALFLFIFIF